MNVYHITYAPTVGTVHLHFWGCNLSCRSCFQVGDNPWRRPTSEEMEKAVGTARKYLLNVSCLTGSEALQFEVRKVF